MCCTCPVQCRLRARMQWQVRGGRDCVAPPSMLRCESPDETCVCVCPAPEGVYFPAGAMSNHRCVIELHTVYQISRIMELR